MKKKILLIIGGHLTPALAVIEEVKKKEDWDVAWVGRKFAMEGRDVPSLEYETIPKLGIPFYNLETGRLQRKLTIWTLPSILRIPRGFFQSFLLLIKIRPRAILSFGGYLSPPIVIAGWLLGIPSILHEQTTTSGLSNRIASFFASQIAISHESSATEFPHQKTILTGNPIRRSILETQRKPTSPPLIFITGGSQGAQIINEAIGKILAKLLDKYLVIHQTGFLDYEAFVAKRKRLVRGKQSRYRVVATLAPDKVARIFSRASLVIGRSGANTTAELASLGISAIFVPLPWSEKGEQQKNARLLENIGLARVIPQEKLTPKLLFLTISEVLANPPPSKNLRAAKKIVKKDAGKSIVSILQKYME